MSKEDERRRRRSLLTIGGAAFAGIAALVAFFGVGSGDGRPTAVAAVSAPLEAAPADRASELLDPLDLQPLTENQAFAFNAAVPISSLPNPAAAPFLLHESDPVAYARALDCMTAAIYYEAGYEPDEGQRAVAQVVLNRLRHPVYPKSVCGVVFQGSERTTGCQFTFTCDGAITRAPDPAGWRRAQKVAAAALAGQVAKQVGYATHYHTLWVAPYWAPTLIKVAKISAHVFYRTSTRDSARLFAGSWSGNEPDMAAMTRLAAFVPLRTALLGTEATAQVDLPQPTLVVEPPAVLAPPVEIASAIVDLPAPVAPAATIAPPPPAAAGNSFFPSPNSKSRRSPLPQL
jgi:spore germination cell wall hydrolase CwlJ-like protein